MPKKRAHRPDGYPAPSARPSPHRPASPSRAPAPATGARARFEDASRPLLLRLKRLPGFLVPALMGITLVLGLALPTPWAGLLLVAIAAFLSWLTALSWPAIGPGSRALRVAVNAGMLGLGVLKLLGRV